MRISSLFLVVLLSPFIVSAAVEVPPASAEGSRFLDLFEPFETEMATISPDGRHIAYSRRFGEQLWITIAPTEAPGTPVTQRLVATDASVPLQFRSKEDTPARIEWLGWVTNDRLVVQTNLPVVRGDWTPVRGVTYVFSL